MRGCRMASSFFTGGLVGKNNPGQLIATQPAVRGDDFPPEDMLDFGEGGLAGLHEPAGDIIHIHDRHGERAQDFCSRGFAHAQTAG